MDFTDLIILVGGVIFGFLLVQIRNHCQNAAAYLNVLEIDKRRRMAWVDLQIFEMREILDHYKNTTEKIPVSEYLNHLDYVRTVEVGIEIKGENYIITNNTFKAIKHPPVSIKPPPPEEKNVTGILREQYADFGNYDKKKL